MPMKSLFWVFCFILSASVAFSQTIDEIRVEGNLVTPDREILDVIETRVGDDLGSPATELRINDDVRAIWALGNFTDVTAKYEVDGTSATIIFEVEEKPTVRNLRFEGNEVYDDDRLLEEAGWEEPPEDQFFDDGLAQSIKAKLLDFYIEKSYPNTTITYRVENAESANQVDLVFEVDEGKKLPVEEIVFEGNEVYFDRTLRSRIQTKESWWFIFKHEYNPSVVQDDIRRIEMTYWNAGYLDVDVTAPEPEEIEDGLRVKFLIDEGKPYTLGSINIAGNTIFSNEELLERFSSQPGDRFSFETIQQDVVNMVNLYREQGYLDVLDRMPPITQMWQKDPINQVVNLNIPINEGSRKYLGGVEIQGVITLDDGTVVPTQEGEFKTKEHVIRHELELQEGEPLDWTKVLESDRNLVNTGFFKTRPYPIPGEPNLMPGFQRVETADPNVENLLLRLEEEQTGTLSFGGGVSTTFGPSVFASVGEQNLFGYGVGGQLTAEWGEFRNRLQLNLNDPSLFNTEYSLDWSIYYIDQQSTGGQTFDQERIGTSFLFGRDLTEYWRALFGFKVETTDLSPEEGSTLDLDPVSIPEIFNLGNNLTTSITLGVEYDTRDFKLDPTRGIYSRTTVEVAGLTDNEFIKFRNLTNYYREIVQYLVLANSAEFQVADAYGDPGFLPLQERYFVGGPNTIRGFDFGSIGEFERIFFKDPVLGSFRSYLGGEASFVNNLEMRYSFTEVFQGVAFFDMGSVWPEVSDIDPSEFRFSTGLGLRIKIPFINAIVRFDFPVVLRDFDEDETELFHFSFGQTF